MSVQKKTIWGAFVSAVALAIGVVVTPTVVQWAGIVLGLGLVTLLGGWSAAGYIRRQYIRPPEGMMHPTLQRSITQREYWATESGKRKIQRAAVRATAVFGAVCSVIFLPFVALDNPNGARIVIAISGLWLVYVAALSFASPFLYTWTATHVFPRLPQLLPGDMPADMRACPTEIDDVTLVGKVEDHVD